MISSPIDQAANAGQQRGARRCEKVRSRVWMLCVMLEVVVNGKGG